MSSKGINWAAEPLKSTITHRFPSSRFAATFADSQIVPSWHSPSPTKQKTLFNLFLILSPSAVPTAVGKPCPSDPVLASTPGTTVTSG